MKQREISALIIIPIAIFIIIMVAMCPPKASVVNDTGTDGNMDTGTQTTIEFREYDLSEPREDNGDTWDAVNWEANPIAEAIETVEEHVESNEVVAAYYYKQGWNEGISKVYAVWGNPVNERYYHYANGELQLYRQVGGFTGTSWERTRESIEDGSWNSETMRWGS